jgi:hypothetical protein
MATVVTGIISGVMLGPPLAGVLFEEKQVLPFVLLVLVLSATTVAAVVLQRRLVSTNNSDTQNQAKNPQQGSGSDQGTLTSLKKSPRQQTAELLCDPCVAATLGGLCCANAAISAFSSSFGVYMKENLQMSVRNIGREKNVGLILTLLKLQRLETKPNLTSLPIVISLLHATGFLYLLASVPCVLGSKAGGHWGNKHGCVCAQFE